MTTMRTFVRVLMAGALASAAMIVAVPAARADGGVTCAIIEIEASTSDPPAMDSALKPLERKLRKPPFSSWNNFKQLGAHTLALEPMKSGALDLVHGKASLILREVATGGGKKPRISLGVTLDDETGKRVLDSKLSVDAGDYLVVGRSLPANKGHLVALTCQP